MSAPATTPFDFEKLELVVERGAHKSRDGEHEADDSDSEGEGEDEFEDETEPWLGIYFVQIKLKKSGKRIGRFGYRIIDKSARAGGAFITDSNGRVLQWNNLALRLQMSEEGGQMLEEFGRALFYDNTPGARRARGVREEFTYGERKGTGVFHEELDKGNIAFFSNDEQYKRDDFLIDEKYRNRGIGTWAMKKILEHESMKGVTFAYVHPWPTLIPAPTRPTPDQFARINNFYRKLGFRRLGQSQYFVYAMDSGHPSRTLSIEDDMAVSHVPPKEEATVPALSLAQLYGF